MQVATDSTVLGNFNDATFEYNGVESRLFRRGDEFWVTTDGTDGTLQDFKIAYTFGHWPLQQYLIPFPGGRMQVLGIAWDARPDTAGGQHWFHLYQNDKVDHTDPLHWTGREQNWNFQCADCHSTNLKKNYTFATDSFATTWSELNVGCEACHGPGSAHNAWAEAQRVKPSDAPDPYRLNRSIRGNPDDLWVIGRDNPIANRQGSPFPSAQLDVCGRCHSRRGVIDDDYGPNTPLLDSHRPALLIDPLYEADGQIRDEVYVYGSFRQSKMYQWGVVCTDCHDAHSMKTRRTGNALCGRCHEPAHYDTEKHHFHKPDTAGSMCVDCHMPAKTYMVVDPRRDHSLRIPRPDLTKKIGTPNACSGCHSDKSVDWAIEKVTEWYGSKTSDSTHYGEYLHAARAGLPGSVDGLIKLASDPVQPAIVRATAVSMLDGRASPEVEDALRKAAVDVDPLVRMAAATAAETIKPLDRPALIGGLLVDSLRAVRIEAGRVMAGVPGDVLTEEMTAQRDSAITEYEHAQEINADRPEAHMNLALLYTGQGDLQAAEGEYRNALRLSPRFIAASINLADLYRMTNRDEMAGKLLEEALVIDPENPSTNHAYGLYLVRKKQVNKALPYLKKAARDPGLKRYNYVYAVALSSVGRKKEAIAVAERALAERPNDADLGDLFNSLRKEP
jgi:hypothetical protein